MEPKIFVNYYEALEISPNASPEAIEHRFRYLARRYHPDNQETGDRSKFDAVIKAHDILKDALKRARYHEDHHNHLPPFSQPVEDESEKTEARDPDGGAEEIPPFDSLGIDRDISIQNSLLIMLYLRRRRNVREPGIGNAELEYLSGCPQEHLDFHIWYLKEKGWVATGADGLLAITINGVDRAAAIYHEGANRLITDQT